MTITIRIPGDCDCYVCTKANVDARGGSPIDPDLQRYFLCPICGNKRCPKGTSHRLECTNSNEPGQKGSRYE